MGVQIGFPACQGIHRWRTGVVRQQDEQEAERPARTRDQEQFAPQISIFRLLAPWLAGLLESVRFFAHYWSYAHNDAEFMCNKMHSSFIQPFAPLSMDCCLY
jgi:hypothetical protein